MKINFEWAFYSMVIVFIFMLFVFVQSYNDVYSDYEDEKALSDYYEYKGCTIESPKIMVDYNAPFGESVYGIGGVQKDGK
jgi:hypothetical protein